MQTGQLYELTISEAAERLRGRQISPIELTESVLRRIDELEGRLNAFITVTADQARAEAVTAEREILAGGWRGPLHGIPIALKDLFDTAGVRTTGGSRILAERIPTADSTVTRRLREAGAVLVGKLNLHEFAFGVSSNNPHFGAVHNPWKLGHVPGGSSGGSGAAVAAGECLGALGTDTGGSIRIPAAFCGIVGLKPTYGRVSRAGVLPLSWSLDHSGPMTRTVRDCALLLNAIAGHDPADPASATVAAPDFTTGLERGVAGLRVGVPRNYFPDIVAPEVARAVRVAVEVLASAGARVSEFDLPRVDALPAISFTLMMSEASAIHLERLRARGADYGEDVRMRLELGLTLPAVQYVQAQQARRLVQDVCLEAMAGFDCFVIPGAPTPAPRIEPLATGTPSHASRLCGPINVLGWPSIAVPCGFSEDRLPLGLQIVGKPWQELTILRAAAAYEAASDWHTRQPAL